MRSLIATLLLFSFACQQASPAEDAVRVDPAPAPFTFAMSQSDGLGIVVRDGAQQPLDRVLVVVRERAEVADDGTTTAGAILYTGLTGPDGQCHDRLERPITLGQVEVTLHRPGFRGRHDDPARLEAHAERAPAAWFTATPAELSALTIDLTSTEKK